MIQERYPLKEGAVCSHQNADSLLGNVICENHENVFDSKLKHLGDVIFRLPVKSDCFFQTKYGSSAICFYSYLF